MLATDILIGFAYITIAATLCILFRKIRVQFSGIVLAFGIFVGTRGATHLIDIWTLWHPDFWLGALVKFFTALASVGACIYLFRSRHAIAAFANASRLAGQRKTDLENAALELEGRVRDRTERLENLANRFSRVARATDLGVWYCDLPFDELIWNEKSKEHFWMEANASVKLSDFYEHILPEDRMRVQKAIERSIDHHEPYDLEYRTIDPRNPLVSKWIRAVGWTDYDSDRKPIRFDGITLDLTQQKDAHEVLARSETRFRQMADNIPQVVWMANAAGQITYASARWYSYTGFTVEQTLGEGWAQAIRPEDLPGTIEKWQASIAGGTVIETYYHLRSKEGVYRDQLVKGVPIKDEMGEVIYWLGTITDVHDFRLSQERLRATEERLDLALVSANIGFWEWNAKTGAVSLSATLMDQYGINQTEFRNTLPEFLRAIHPDDRGEILRRTDSTAFNDPPYDIEYRVLKKSGETLWMNAKGRHYQDEEKRPERLTGISIDITSQKEAAAEIARAKEQAERANRMKSTFLANMSHEIRTPLAAIVGFSDLLSNVISENESAQNYLERITRNSKQLSQLIDELLDLSKIEANRLEIERGEVRLSQLLEDSLSSVTYVATTKKLEVELQTAPGLPDSIFVDATRLKQILINLLGNAVKFTDKGGVKLNAFSTEFEHKSTLHIEVSDTGIGLTSEQAGQLFSAFHQADSSISRRYGGTGLGLALSRELAHLMGGELRLAHSVPGLGSTFCLSIPLEAVHQPKAAIAAVSGAPRPRERLTHRKVLVVDDSPDNRMLVIKFLEPTGIAIETAVDGSEAINKVAQQDFDLVLMDLQMPTVDGYQAIAKIRETHPTLPVVALTAHALIEEKQRAFHSGFNEYVTKPINRVTLIEIVYRFLN